MTNSAHFSYTISREKIQNHKIMVSFNVESLFSNVSIEGAVEATRIKFECDPSLADRTTFTPAQIVDLLDSVL